MVISGLIGSTNQFNVFFDTPSVQRLSFGRDGRIFAMTGSSSTGYSNALVGYFPESTEMKLEIEVDTRTNKWQVYINNSLLHSGPFTSELGLLRSVRLSLGNVVQSSPQDYRSMVYVDRVCLAVPESSVLSVVCVGPLLLVRRRRI